MNIPKSYEALAADLASEKILSKTLLGQKEAYMMLADKGRLDLSESKAREDALLEGLSRLADDYCEKVDDILDLQQRLTVAEQLLTSIASTIPHIEANNKESAREIVRRINAVLIKSKGGSES